MATAAGPRVGDEVKQGREKDSFAPEFFAKDSFGGDVDKRQKDPNWGFFEGFNKRQKAPKGVVLGDFDKRQKEQKEVVLGIANAVQELMELIKTQKRRNKPVVEEKADGVEPQNPLPGLRTELTNKKRELVAAKREALRIEQQYNRALRADVLQKRHGVKGISVGVLNGDVAFDPVRLADVIRALDLHLAEFGRTMREMDVSSGRLLKAARNIKTNATKGVRSALLYELNKDAAEVSQTLHDRVVGILKRLYIYNMVVHPAIQLSGTLILRMLQHPDAQDLNERVDFLFTWRTDVLFVFPERRGFMIVPPLERLVDYSIEDFMQLCESMAQLFANRLMILTRGKTTNPSIKKRWNPSEKRTLGTFKGVSQARKLAIQLADGLPHQPTRADFDATLNSVYGHHLEWGAALDTRFKLHGHPAAEEGATMSNNRHLELCLYLSCIDFCIAAGYRKVILKGRPRKRDAGLGVLLTQLQCDHTLFAQPVSCRRVFESLVKTVQLRDSFDSAIKHLSNFIFKSKPGLVSTVCSMYRPARRKSVFQQRAFKGQRGFRRPVDENDDDGRKPKRRRGARR